MLYHIIFSHGFALHRAAPTYTPAYTMRETSGISCHVQVDHVAFPRPEPSLPLQPAPCRAPLPVGVPSPSGRRTPARPPDRLAEALRGRDRRCHEPNPCDIPISTNGPLKSRLIPTAMPARRLLLRGGVQLARRRHDGAVGRRSADRVPGAGRPTGAARTGARW